MRLLSIVFLIFFATPALADENSEANKLAVASRLAFDRAASEPDPAKRLEMLRRVAANFDTIVEKYPGSNLAPQILNGDSVAGLTKTSIQGRIKLAEANKCIVALPPTCGNDAAAVGTTLATAKELVAVIHDEHRRLREELNIVVASQQAGHLASPRNDVRNILVRVRSLPLDEDRARSLAYVSLAQALTGDEAGARKSLKLALNDVKKFSAKWSSYVDYRPIAAAHMASGNSADAVATAGREPDDKEKYKTLYTIALVAAWRGDISGAMSIAESIGGGAYRARTMASIAEAQLAGGHRASAARTLKLADRTVGTESDDLEYLEALARLSRVHVKLDDREAVGPLIETARNRLGAIDQEWLRAYSWKVLALMQVHNGDPSAARSLGRAIDLAREMEDRSNAISNFVEISIVYSEAKDLAAARAVLSTAGEATASLGKKDDQASNMALLALGWARAGDLEKATTLAGNISDRFYRDYALTMVARVLVSSIAPKGLDDFLYYPVLGFF